MNEAHLHAHHHQPRNGERWHLSRQITIGNLMVVLTVCGAVAAGWYGYEKRLTTVEGIAGGNRAILEKLEPTLDRLERSTDLLQQRLRDYPLHRHVDGEIIYPDGQMQIRPPRLR